MRFWSFVKKELREALLWIALAAIVLGIAATFIIKFFLPSESRYMYYPDYSNNQNYMAYGYFKYSPISEFGMTLLLTSIGLGVALGIVQFGMPGVGRLWPLTIHRSFSRGKILLAKMTAAAAGFLLILMIWTGLFFYASRSGYRIYPPAGHVYYEGCIMILIGAMAYLALCQASISRAKWYTTRKFPVIFAFILMIFALGHSSLLISLGLICAAMVIIACQFVYDFLNLEF